MVIGLCGFGTGASTSHLPWVKQLSPPTEDSFVGVSGSTAIDLSGSVQLIPSRGPASTPMEGCLNIHSQILLDLSC